MTPEEASDLVCDCVEYSQEEFLMIFDSLSFLSIQSIDSSSMTFAESKLDKYYFNFDSCNKIVNTSESFQEIKNNRKMNLTYESQIALCSQPIKDTINKNLQKFRHQYNLWYNNYIQIQLMKMDSINKANHSTKKVVKKGR